MRQVMTSVAGGKILLAKTNWFFHEKSSIFDRNFTYMSGPTCHSTCPLPQRVLLSKRTSRLYESLPEPCAAPFCVSKAILLNLRCLAARKSQFFMDCFKLFPYPMDRAEVLHAQSYNISGRRKNTPGENELVLP